MPLTEFKTEIDRLVTDLSLIYTSLQSKPCWLMEVCWYRWWGLSHAAIAQSASWMPRKSKIGCQTRGFPQPRSLGWRFRISVIHREKLPHGQTRLLFNIHRALSEPTFRTLKCHTTNFGSLRKIGWRSQVQFSLFVYKKWLAWLQKFRKNRLWQ